MSVSNKHDHKTFTKSPASLLHRIRNILDYLILDHFKPNLKYEDSENIKADFETPGIMIECISNPSWRSSRY